MPVQDTAEGSGLFGIVATNITQLSLIVVRKQSQDGRRNGNYYDWRGH